MANTQMKLPGKLLTARESEGRGTRACRGGCAKSSPALLTRGCFGQPSLAHGTSLLSDTLCKARYRHEAPTI